MKAIGLPEITADSLCHEWLGGHMARAAGLAAPATALMNLSSEFLADVAADLATRGLQPKPGIAVGIELVPNLVTFPSPPNLADEEMDAAARILVFDLLVQNPESSAR